MSVKYKLLKYHGHFSTRSDFRAVTIENQVVGIERMGKNIQSASSLTQSDVIAAVAALKEEISFQLMSGNAVHLPGIGYFTLSVKGKLYQDPRSGHYRLRDP
ncbi:MAG: DNA-binding protein, partial [Prevotella histicola]|nr:DNA-binding protein [Prevotella histicola]